MSIKKIAEQAGVSIATVSRVINQPEVVHPQTRETVLKIIEKLNYTPNPLAKSLLTGKTQNIALIVPTLRNQFFVEIVEGIENYLKERNYNVTIFNTHASMSRQESILEYILKKRLNGFADGVILAGSGAFQEGYEKSLNSVKAPIVAIEYIPDHDYSCVWVDDSMGARLAIEHLVKLGHQRIGIIAAKPDFLSTRRRVQSAETVLAEHNLPWNDELISYGSALDTLACGAEAVAKLLDSKKRPTAIFAINDVLAIGALKYVQEKKFRVPQDISIIGFDDIPMSEFCFPGLTTLKSPTYEIGQTAARILLNHLDQNSCAVNKVLLSPELIVRGSTGPV